MIALRGVFHTNRAEQLLECDEYTDRWRSSEADAAPMMG